MGTGYEIARALALVIKNGHPPDTAWKYTPRQLQGWTELLERDRLGDLHQLLSILLTSQGAEKKEVDKALKRLSELSQ